MDTFLGQVTISRAILVDFTGTTASNKTRRSDSDSGNPFGDTAGARSESGARY